LSKGGISGAWIPEQGWFLGATANGAVVLTRLQHTLPAEAAKR
jgi:hypothetical protein